MTESPRQPDRGVLVVGGGLAGIAAAVQLADAGVRVTLLETRQRLGGRATSFTDPETGRTLDNCQHVLLGCCTQLVALYERLGVSRHIDWHRQLCFTDRSGAIDVLEADDLPAPLHMTRSLMSFRTLTLGQKLAIARGMMAIMRVSREKREQLDALTFRDWLADHGQNDEVIRKFWAVIVISAINELPERMAASHAIQVFQEGFLSHEQAYVMGVAAVPLVRLYDAAEQVITAAGGRVLLSASAEQLQYGGGRVSGVQLARGERLPADAVISAVPFDRLLKLAPAALRDADPRLQSLDRFTVSPIIGIHLLFDARAAQPIMTLPHLVLMDSPLQWLFNKGLEDAGAWGLDGGGEVQHLHGVVSAAHDLVAQPSGAIVAMAEREVRQALPASSGAVLRYGLAIKEKRATFSAAPGTAALRPPARGNVANLYLAGDWCRTGWPATMEGAVRSGCTAAAACLADLDMPAPPPPPDLAARPLYRLLAR